MSKYSVEKYNPRYYTEQIKKTIQNALKSGMRVEIEDNEIIVENTTSEDEQVLSFDNLWEDLREEYEIKVEYGYDNYFPTVVKTIKRGDEFRIPQVLYILNDTIFFEKRYNGHKNSFPFKEGLYKCEHDIVVGLICNISIKKINK